MSSGDKLGAIIFSLTFLLFALIGTFIFLHGALKSNDSISCAPDQRPTAQRSWVDKNGPNTADDVKMTVYICTTGIYVP